MNVAAIARALKLDRLPVVGAWLRETGRFVNAWRHRDAGVVARVDGEVDLRLSPWSFSGGDYALDPRLTRELRKLADPGRDFLDVGAHVGIASLLYSRFTDRQARIAAFEPNPNVFHLLFENNRVNGMPIELYRMALGDTIGMANFYVDGNAQEASLSGEAPVRYWEGKARPPMSRCVVPITTIDAFCAATGFRPGLIKLDVEGAELQALNGASRTLARDRPLILLETHVFAWESFGYRREDLEQAIAGAGYQVCDEHGQLFLGPLGSGPGKDNNHFLLRPS
jgi:FkbM family methyltransferase